MAPTLKWLRTSDRCLSAVCCAEDGACYRFNIYQLTFRRLCLVRSTRDLCAVITFHSLGNVFAASLLPFISVASFFQAANNVRADAAQPFPFMRPGTFWLKRGRARNHKGPLIGISICGITATQQICPPRLYF